MKNFLYLIILLFLGTASFAQNKPVKPIVSQRPKVKPVKTADTPPLTPVADQPVTPAVQQAVSPVSEAVTPVNNPRATNPVVNTPAVNSVVANSPVATSAAAVAAPLVKKPKIKTPPKDGFFARKDVDSSVMVPYADVREEDVFYSKRIWREIDLRDTINSVLNTENAKLIEILLEAIGNEELTAYSPKDTTSGKLLEDNDSFKIALTSAEALRNARGTSEGEADAKGKIGEPVLKRLRADEFLKYRIKEDWILDVKRSVFEPRIVGLAPLKMVEGNWQPVFWIYYDEARTLLSKKKLQDPANDASVLTFDDFFVRRLFSSNIVKETNPANKTIVEILNQTDPKDPRKLYESERIKKGMADYEQSLWEY
ncbi:gliding motility associated protein GldN [Pedobacter cryoconitis]|uniref:Gliding motility associated protein GldN n=1 Tax=Pedobacter cryoconitis TaxID=188932 RepID=A0A7W8ZKQ8_9SPHI|nr:gliding motility protein GldN [Pedobacter cryoconitis]MBB5635832.1 gliding motility associated protein GldN [Pedobacter cryoconitis]